MDKLCPLKKFEPCVGESCAWYHVLTESEVKRYHVVGRCGIIFNLQDISFEINQVHNH